MRECLTDWKYLDEVEGTAIQNAPFSLIGYTEAVRNGGELYAMHLPGGGFVVFAAAGVSRLLGVPTAAMS
jgi:hypothetical protein